jgi:hypothetical protein
MNIKLFIYNNKILIILFLIFFALIINTVIYSFYNFYFGHMIETDVKVNYPDYLDIFKKGNIPEIEADVTECHCLGIIYITRFYTGNNFACLGYTLKCFKHHEKSFARIS